MTTLTVTLEGRDLLCRPIGPERGGPEHGGPEHGGRDGIALILDDHLAVFDREHVERVAGAADFWEAVGRFLTDPALRAENPCALFDTRHYTAQCGPLPGLHPVLHYILVGDAAGLDPHPFVAAAWIRERYALPAGATALGFLLQDTFCIAPNPYFDPVYYQSINNDVFRSGIPPLHHYLEHGAAEGRNFHALFNIGWYRKVCGDKAAALERFLEKRSVDGIFPHPKARAGWATLPARDLGALFAGHLIPTSRDRQARHTPPGLELMPDVFEDEQRSIQASFPHRRGQAVERALLDHYRAHEALGRILVSVVIPTKNRLSTLRAAVASARSQSHRAVEILVVDDGGSDGTEAWIEGLNDPRILYVRRPALGVSAARNHALDMARGKYVTFLDSDNAHTPNFVAALLSFCERDGVSLAYGALRLYNQGGEVRYRFREYSRNDYWKTNYIDLNVLFHSREDFRDVRFDETLRRCVDWDYILAASALTPPVGVPIVGCDYAHDRNELDRITMTGPVWDCFRVCQAHRPRTARTGRVPDAIVLPVTSASAMGEIRRLCSDLEHLPGGWLVQAAYSLEVPPEARLAIRSLLVSSGHPEPLLSTAPLCPGALSELAAATRPFAADRWHLLDPSMTLPLTRLVGLATAGGEVTAVTTADDDGDATVEAMRYDHGSRLWEYAETDRDGIGRDCLPLRTSLLNVPGFAIEGMELRFSGSLTLPLLLAQLWGVGDVRVVIERGRVSARLDTTEVFAGLDLLNAAGALAPPEARPRDAVAVTSAEHRLDGAGLRTVRRWRRLSGRKPLAVFTPAPGAGSGWGDEYYATALAAAMRGRGIDCDVVYRDAWSHRRDSYAAIVHLRGIIPVVPSWTAHNLLWVISHPEAVGDGEYAGCESVAVASRPFADQLATVLARPVHHLPQCTAFTPPEEADGWSDKSALADYALFLGDSKHVNRHPINDLIPGWERLFLIGPRWGDLPGMGVRYLPQLVDNRILPHLYAAFGVVLNQHWESMAQRGFVSNRIYDVLASGGQLVTDHCEGIPEDIRDRIVVWRGGSMEEAFQAARALRGPDAIERAHAFAATHSFARRVESLLSFWEKDAPDLRL